MRFRCSLDSKHICTREAEMRLFIPDFILMKIGLKSRFSSCQGGRVTLLRDRVAYPKPLPRSRESVTLP